MGLRFQLERRGRLHRHAPRQPRVGLRPRVPGVRDAEVDDLGRLRDRVPLLDGRGRVFGQDCDWATIRYNVSDILTYQQEYKIGVDLKDEAMKIYIDGHHTISYNMSAVNCLAGSIGFKTFYSDLEVRNLTVANSSTPILSGLGLAGW